jgi:nitrate/nitrite-specific signal transduction histidine kinase
MGERARRLGGQCVVSQREPIGTLVSLRVPLSRDQGVQLADKT